MASSRHWSPCHEEETSQACPFTLPRPTGKSSNTKPGRHPDASPTPARCANTKRQTTITYYACQIKKCPPSLPDQKSHLPSSPYKSIRSLVFHPCISRHSSPKRKLSTSGRKRHPSGRGGSRQIKTSRYTSPRFCIVSWVASGEAVPLFARVTRTKYLREARKP